MATTALTPAAAAYRSGLYEWVTTTDHKKIGALYVVNSFIFFFLAGLLALGIRSELAVPGLQILKDEGLYNQFLTMHGTVMIMLFIDRNYGGHFFDPQFGGNAVLWQNVFWFYSHPAVYIMVLPAMGIISEVLPVFSRKPLFGYKAFVFATAGIGALGFSVWAHHMFTTGSVFLPFFSLMTFLIAVPTGVKMFNWVFTLWRGKITLSTPLLFALGFLSMFLIGGINGAFSASVPVDFALHDTYWVVAHLHYVLFGGSVFGGFAATYYWFPKMTGRML